MLPPCAKAAEWQRCTAGEQSIFSLPTIAGITGRISTQDRAVDLAKSGKPSFDLALAERKFNTAGTEFIPGIRSARSSATGSFTFFNIVKRR